MPLKRRSAATLALVVAVGWGDRELAAAAAAARRPSDKEEGEENRTI